MDPRISMLVASQNAMHIKNLLCNHVTGSLQNILVTGKPHLRLIRVKLIRNRDNIVLVAGFCYGQSVTKLTLIYVLINNY